MKSVVDGAGNYNALQGGRSHMGRRVVEVNSGLKGNAIFFPGDIQLFDTNLCPNGRRDPRGTRL